MVMFFHLSTLYDAIGRLSVVVDLRLVLYTTPFFLIALLLLKVKQSATPPTDLNQEAPH